MGVFSDIEHAKSFEGGIYFLEGNYLVEIQRCKLGSTRKNREFFVVETKVIESNNAERKSGSLCNWMVMLDNDSAKGNIADFMRVSLAALAGQRYQTPTLPKDVPLDEATANHVVSEENPLAGIRLAVFAFNKPTKEGNPFTRINWLIPG